jgi:Ca2+-binding EF-hand superfamily protein
MFLDKSCQQNGISDMFSDEIFRVMSKKIDKNRDGKISIDEFLEYYVDGEIRIRNKHNEVVRMMA